MYVENQLFNENSVEFFEALFENQSLYGGKLSHILWGYDLLKEKAIEGLERTARIMSVIYKDIDVDTLTQREKDCLYLVLNYGICHDEAEEIINEATCCVRDIDDKYLQLVYDLNGDGNFITRKIPYRIFQSVENGVREVLGICGVNITNEKYSEYECFLFEYIVKHFPRNDIETWSDEFVDKLISVIKKYRCE